MSVKTLISAAVLAALVPLSAEAQTAGAIPVRQACKAEITSLCADQVGQQGGVFRCLMTNQAKLGPDCSGAIKAVQDRRAAFRAACKADIDKLCAGSAPAAGGGGVVACLKGKSAELSKPCSDALATMPQATQKQ